MPSARFLPLFIGEFITVTVTSPLEGATITNAAPVITWTFSPGIQQAFRVRIYEDANRAVLVYDSGNTASAVQQHTVPDGEILSGQTYFLLITIETTDADVGESEIVSFSTLFTPSVAIVGVTIATENENCDGSDLRGLPAVLIGWNQVVPAGDETFQRYSIWRRPRLHPRHPDAGDEIWERIGSVAAVATLAWRDYCGAPRVVYEYAVTWTALTTAGDTRTSDRQSVPVNVIMKFDRIVMHDVQDPTLFAVWTPQNVSVGVEQSIDLRSVWGRRAPTALVSDFEFHTIAINGVPEVHRGPVWRDTRGLMGRQRSGSTICVRLGYAGERFFAAITSPFPRADGFQQHAMSVNLTETHFEEAVA